MSDQDKDAAQKFTKSFASSLREPSPPTIRMSRCACTEHNCSCNGEVRNPGPCGFCIQGYHVKREV